MGPIFPRDANLGNNTTSVDYRTGVVEPDNKQRCFNAYVSVRMMPANTQVKWVTVLADEAAHMPWELSSDENAYTIGSEKTPFHPNHLAAGLGLFLLSHAERLAKRSDLNILDAYLEKRLSWSTEEADDRRLEPALPYGKAEVVELVLVIKSLDSQEPRGELRKFCRQVQRAVWAITAADQISVAVYLNGRVAGQTGPPFRGRALIKSNEPSP